MERTPEDVVRALVRGVGRLRSPGLSARDREALLDELAGLYAERTDVRHPFNPYGDQPLRTRAELRAHFAARGEPPAGLERWAAVDVVVHQTGDPEVVVQEFRYAGRIQGQEFAVPLIFVTRVRDGVIVESRDYADHVGLARAFGHLPELAAALAAH
jgi:ketosteroid isomerase-like protein